MGHILNSPGRIKVKGTTVSATRPTWRSSMLPYTWSVVPVSTTLSQVDPASNPALNPNAVSAAPWRGASGASAALDAWGCLLPAYDSDDGRLWMPLGGGHGDYGGNEGYVLNLKAESPAWSMIGRPSGNLIDGLLSYGDAPGGDFTTGTYTDGRIRSKHSYTDFVHIPGTDNIACMRLTTGFGGGNANATRCWLINGVTGSHSLLANYSALPGRGGNHGGGAAWDSTRQVIWHHGINASGKILKTNPVNGITTEHGPSDNRVGAISQLVYVPTIDRIVYMRSYFSALISVFDPTAETWTNIFSIGGSTPTGFNGSYRDAGPVWVPGLNAIAMWNNNLPDSGTITLLRPPVTMGGAWNWEQLAPAGANAVLPTARNANGTFGKFGYSAALNGFYLQNRYAENLYFFSLD